MTPSNLFTAPPLAAVQRFWQTLGTREQRLLGWASGLVLLALLWWLAVSPALQTLRTADARHRSLDVQVQTMRNLASQAAVLKTQPKASYDEALRLLEASVTQRLGAQAQLGVIGERATVTLKGASAEALAQWLVQVRANARVLPEEARLSRSGALWDGTLVLILPAR